MATCGMGQTADGNKEKKPRVCDVDTDTDTDTGANQKPDTNMRKVDKDQVSWHLKHFAKLLKGLRGLCYCTSSRICPCPDPDILVEQQVPPSFPARDERLGCIQTAE